MRAPQEMICLLERRLIFSVLPLSGSFAQAYVCLCQPFDVLPVRWNRQYCSSISSGLTRKTLLLNRSFSKFYRTLFSPLSLC